MCSRNFFWQVPLVVLYEAGIVCVRIFGKKIEDDEEKEDDEKQSA